MATGEYGNSTFGGSVDNNTQNKFLEAGDEDDIHQGDCKSNYYNINKPKIQCLYKDSNNNIDEVFLKFVKDHDDCQSPTCFVNNGSIYNIQTNYSGFYSTIKLKYEGLTTGLLSGQSVNLSNTVNPNSYTDTNSGSAKLTCKDNGTFDKKIIDIIKNAQLSSSLYSAGGYGNEDINELLSKQW